MASEAYDNEMTVAQTTISDVEFSKFKQLIYELAGISLSDAKKALVVSRLSKRLRHHNLSSFGDYYRIVTDKRFAAEQQIMVDLLTTNETYFFREPKHFEFLSQQAMGKQSWTQPLRVWSAAASSGEEAYTMAMVLDDAVGDRAWEIIGTDISTRVLETAKRGLYSLHRTDKIPKPFLAKYCLRGVRSQQGTLLVDKKLRSRVAFHHLNLLGQWPQLGEFDAVFLRNVMIYFDTQTKQDLVSKIYQHIKPGGYFFIGHSETLNGIFNDFKTVIPSVYQKKV